MNEERRRKLLKLLTLSGGVATVTKLPATWSKPVVDSVILPAHAQTTSCIVYYGEDLPYGRFCVTVCGDSASISGVAGGVDIDDTDTPKFVWSGQATTNSNNDPGTLSVVPSQSGENCLSRVGENFLSSRDVFVLVFGNHGLLRIREGDGGLWDIQLLPVEECPAIPPATDCEPAEG